MIKKKSGRPHIGMAYASKLWIGEKSVTFHLDRLNTSDLHKSISKFLGSYSKARALEIALHFKRESGKCLPRTGTKGIEMSLNPVLTRPRKKEGREDSHL